MVIIEALPGPKNLDVQPRKDIEKVDVAKVLIQGFSVISKWAKKRDIENLNAVKTLTVNMQGIADIFSTETGKEEQIAKNMQEIGGSLTAVRDAIGDNGPLDPGEIDPRALEFEAAFPLVVHDLKNQLTPIEGYNKTLNKFKERNLPINPSFEEMLNNGWVNTAAIADEGVEFLKDPGYTYPIVLADASRVLQNAAKSQSRAFDMVIDVEKVPETNSETINLSRFLLNSLMVNQAQNTRRATQMTLIKPILSVQIATEAGQAAFIFQDNGPGFSEDYLERGITGYASGAESTGVALRSLNGLIEHAGGRVRQENNKGAKTTITFPLHHGS